jgi:COP9 signalosome complex subunit 2
MPELSNCRYDFEYEDGSDNGEDTTVELDNQYYSAKQMKIEDPEEAIKMFLAIPGLEEEKGEWQVLMQRRCPSPVH